MLGGSVGVPVAAGMVATGYLMDRADRRTN